jgi:uncharacterized membrane protein
MTDKPDGKRWGWMTKRLAGLIFLMAFILLIGLVGSFALVEWSIAEKIANGASQSVANSQAYASLFLIGLGAVLVLWVAGFCVWAGAKGYSPLIGIPMALIMPPIGIAMLARYLPDKR